jgi:hypothetical protein
MQITFRIGTDFIRYRSNAPRTVTGGQRFHIRLALEGARLFDRETGTALRGS